MKFKQFLKMRRKELHLSQANVADMLSGMGHETSPARVGHWETGRNQAPLEDAGFRDAIALVLQFDTNEMMSTLGYVVIESERSKEAQIAAMIVDQLSADKKKLALGILEQIRLGA